MNSATFVHYQTYARKVRSEMFTFEAKKVEQFEHLYIPFFLEWPYLLDVHVGLQMRWGKIHVVRIKQGYVSS